MSITPTRILALPLVLSFTACMGQELPVDRGQHELSTGVAPVAIDRAVAHLEQSRELLGLGTSDELRVRDVLIESGGAEHVRFDRSVQGLRVIGGDFITHSDGLDSMGEISATLTDSLDKLDLVPGLASSKAVQLARFAVKGARSTGAVDLVINAHERAPALAWEVMVYGEQADGTPIEAHVIIDAQNGAVQDTWDDIHTANATGTGKTLYSGNITYTTNSISTGFELRDLSRGVGFRTTNMKNKTSGSGTTFTDSDNVWGNNSTSDTVTVGADAHYGHMLTFDYYKNVHGRNGIDNAGNSGYSRVHYSRNYNNAFWSDSCFCMTYGDGDGSVLSPLVSIDVAGHEMSHGVTSRTAGLIYSGESGGLNEGTSDILGSMVEYYAGNATRPPDYLIGEDVYTPATSGDALRYMHKPSTDGHSADCWSSSVGNLDVHYSSGVANHFFYLLAEGSGASPSSPTCNGSSVTGIGRSAAERIWYRALTVYMTSSTKYSAARTATLNAASDLFGATSSQRNAVAAAWSAVNVN